MRRRAFGRAFYAFTMKWGVVPGKWPDQDGVSEEQRFMMIIGGALTQLYLMLTDWGSPHSMGARGLAIRLAYYKAEKWIIEPKEARLADEHTADPKPLRENHSGLAAASRALDLSSLYGWDAEGGAAFDKLNAGQLMTRIAAAGGESNDPIIGILEAGETTLEDWRTSIARYPLGTQLEPGEVQRFLDGIASRFEVAIELLRRERDAA